MREIVVISGKGGTGKTSVCASLAHLASGQPAGVPAQNAVNKVVICDLDVDAPDMHLLLAPEVLQKHKFLSGNTAEIDPSRCVRCGKCADLCRFGAVSRVGGKYVVNEMDCEGCGVCYKLCPAQAIEFPERECGEWYISHTRFGTMAHALLYPGQENSGRLVSLLKQQAREIARSTGAETVLCDGSPGVGCPVISSLSGATLAVTVVEPTPSGVHDFQRVADLCDHFRIPVAIVINKADLNPDQTERLRQLARDQHREVVAELPFSPDVTQAMVAGRALSECDSPMARLLASAWEKIDGLAARAVAHPAINL